jgi:ATP-binding cassette, subfamily C (CFTR/MRP), member 1
VSRSRFSNETYAAYVTQVFAPIITLAAFATISRNRGGDVVLDAARLYTSLSLFTLLAEPLGSLVMSLSAFFGSVGCFTRIQEFLDKEIHVDSRDKQLYFPESITKGFKPLADSTKSNATTKEHKSTESLKTSYPSFTNDVVFIQEASFGWDTEQDPLLKNISFTLPTSKLTLLVGPVGCGKSTLLKAVLGEVPCSQGCIRVSSESFAFCDQTPWHTNETIRNSILALGSFEEKWYQAVIRACALEEDLHQLPKGDETVIGSNGVALSMGQSQRVVRLGTLQSVFNVPSKIS